MLKGFRHPTATTVSRTARILTSLLAIIAKPHKRDKFEVTPESVAYLAGKSVSVSIQPLIQHCLVRPLDGVDIHLKLKDDLYLAP